MKESVKKNFSKGVKKYRQFALIQREVSENLKRLFEKAKPELPVLDVGSGLKSALTEFPQVVTLDIAIGMCLEAKKYFAQVVNGDGENLPFKDESFGSLFCSFSLHWMDLEKALKEFSRVLKPNGWIFLAVPVYGSLKRLYTAWNTAYEEFYGEKDRLFSFPEMKEIAKIFVFLFEPVLIFVQDFVRYFKSPKEAVNHINKTGAKNPFRNPRYFPKQLVKRFFQLYKDEKGYPVEFKVLFAVGKRR
jgi:malonyl-CoA O-methyltransferase